MNMDITNIKKLIVETELDSLLWEEMEDEDSSTSRLIKSFTLNFILKNLSVEKRKDFSRIVPNNGTDSGCGSLNIGPYQSDATWNFVYQNIAEFEKRYQDALTEKLQEIKEKTVGCRL